MRATDRSLFSALGPFLTPPPQEAFVRFAPDFGKRFMLVVDTEEEFDWLATFDRASTQVTAIEGMRRGQSYFTEHGVRPLWVIDWPIADHPEVGAMLAQWVADGLADVGAHLHPWVNPPHDEIVSVPNSFAGSLPHALERAKLLALRDRIEQAVGVRPIAYRAGRYGVGPNSADILQELGFRIDTSVRSRFDYSAQHGPDFSHMPLYPYFINEDRSLAELPLSTAFCGPLAGIGEHLNPVLERKSLGAGLLSRLGLLERVPLTPEGVPLEAAIRAIDALLGEGVELLMFSFHSPTLEPGHTFYVRDAAELSAFYRWWDGVLDHLSRRNVLPAGLQDVVGALPPHP